MKTIRFILIIYFVFCSNVFGEKILPIFEGKTNAKIKLVIYESLTCSHCADFHTKVYPKIKEEFLDTGLISIDFKNFPLDLAALNASKLAHCRNDGKSEILHTLYKNQKVWIKGKNIVEINNNLEEFITNEYIGLNFQNCLNNEILENYILEERIAGSKKYKIEATPTLIINEKKFEKPINYKNLKKILKKMI